MRNFIFISIITLGLAACMQNEAGDDQLSQLKSEKDSLKAVYEELGQKIAELDEQIALIDTSKKLTLVTTRTLEIQPFDHYFEVQGNVEAEKNAMIFPEAPGTIRSIHVREGQKVNQGDLLVQLDDDILRKSITEARTSFDLAKTVYEKQSSLWKQKIGSEMQYLQAKTNKEAAEARLGSLNAQLEQLAVRAPFAGVIDEIFPKLGESAGPQTPVLRIINLSSVYIKSEVSESYLGTIDEGTAVLVSIPSLKEEIPSKISLTGNYINPNNRTFKVQVDIENKEGMLKPNLLTILKIRDFHADSVIVLPESMIQQTPSGEDFVYLLDQHDGYDYVKKKMIKTGITYKNMVMVTEGLEEGEKIIEKGARSVKDGQRIEIAG